jgi:hypothetical protein
MFAKWTMREMDDARVRADIEGLDIWEGQRPGIQVSVVSRAGTEGIEGTASARWDWARR